MIATDAHFPALSEPPTTAEKVLLVFMAATAAACFLISTILIATASPESRLSRLPLSAVPACTVTMQLPLVLM